MSTITNKLLLLCCIILFSVTTTAQTKEILFELTAKDAIDSSKAWLILTDRIMRGNSKAEVIRSDTSIRFSGEISNQNSAGIAQLISPKIDKKLQQYKGITLRVRGDDSQYIIALLPDTFSSKAQHLEYRFTAPSAWYNIKIPFDAFVCAYFDVPLLTESPPLASIRHLCIINAYQEGKFQLEIDSIGLY